MRVKNYEYLEKYRKLIEVANKDNYPAGYKEKHHIVPKCIGGGDNKENIIELSYADHIKAHIYLYYAYEYKGLAHAVHRMINSKWRGEILTDEELADLTEERIKFVKRMRGEGNPFYGMRHSKESKEKMSKSSKGKGGRNKPHTKETKQRLSKVMKGKGVGSNNPRYDSTIYTFINKEGEIFKGTKYEICKKYSIDRSNLNNLFNGRQKTCKGWRIYE